MNEEKPVVPTAASSTPSTVPVGLMAEPSSSADFPAELHGWNWGAFFLNWIWGVSHRVWVSLLILPFALIPVLGGIGVLAVMVVLGLKGNEWAWKNRHFESVEQFRAVQKAWAIWGLVLFVLGLIAGAFFFSALVAALGDQL